MAKKINAKNLRLSVRCSENTFSTMKDIALLIGDSDSDVIEKALLFYKNHLDKVINLSNPELKKQYHDIMKPYRDLTELRK